MPTGQLTTDERYVITHMHMAGRSKADIARQLGRHRGSIGRELKRNACPKTSGGIYHYEQAQRLASERRAAASRRCRMDEPTLCMAVREKLRQSWSPQHISARLRIDHPDDPAMRVSHETIYQWVYQQAARGADWYLQLRRRRRRRRRRNARNQRQNKGIPGRVGIEHRPAVVDRRRRFGHWESDTVEGSKGTGALATHVERTSRYLCVGKLTDKQASTMSAVTGRLLGDLPAKLRRTMTADNGREFTRFASIERRLSLKVYFANPHSPWERGTNENTNGLLRDFFPKGTDFTTVTHAQVARVQWLLNTRPRKCLNYRTPLEVLNALPGVALRG